MAAVCGNIETHNSGPGVEGFGNMSSNASMENIGRVSTLHLAGKGHESPFEITWLTIRIHQDTKEFKEENEYCGSPQAA